MFFWSGSPYWKIKHWSKMSESEIMIHSIYGNRFISLSSLLPLFPLWYSLRIPEESYLIVFFPSVGLLGSVQSLGHVLFFVTPWTGARQASVSITNSRSLSKLMSIMSVMPSNHLILCHPLLLLPSVFPSIRVFSDKSVLCIRWPKYWSFSLSISPSNEYSGLVSFRMDWIGSRDSQESSPTPLFKSIYSSVLSFLYSPTLTSIHDNWKNHSLD